jgi:serine/threonine protein kinase
VLLFDSQLGESARPASAVHAPALLLRTHSPSSELFGLRIRPFSRPFHPQEIGILKSISYDRNIVQFYGATMVGTEPMLLLEYCEGGDLRCASQVSMCA